jgi:K+-transporting ATPase KdpF subunit
VTIDNVVGLALAVALAVYLLVVLLFAERM